MVQLPELVDPEGYAMDKKFMKCLEKGMSTLLHISMSFETSTPADYKFNIFMDSLIFAV